MQTHQAMQTDIDFQEFKQILIEKKWFILLIGLLTFSIAMLYTIYKPKFYQASVLLELQHTQQSSLGSLANANSPLFMLNNTNEPASVQIALIRSKYILGEVVHSLGLDIEIQPQSTFDFKHFFKRIDSENFISQLEVPQKYLNEKLELVFNNKTEFSVFNPKHKLLLAGKIGELIKNSQDFSIHINKFPTGKNTTFTVIKHADAIIINQLRANLVTLDLSNSSENSNKTSILQLTLTGENPDKVIKLINKIALVNQEKDRERKSQESKKTLKFLMEQLPLIYNSLKEAEEKLNLYRSTSGKIDIKLQAQFLLTHLSDIDKQSGEIRLKRMDMLQQYTLQHPFIISLNQKSTELRKQRLKILNQIKNLPAADQVAANFTRDVKVKNNLYMNLLNKIHEQEVITSGVISDIRILSLANFAELLLPPKLPIIGLASLIFGLIFGGLIFIGLHLLRRRINNPSWIERNLNVENLLVMPYSKNQANYSKQLISPKQLTLPLLAFSTPTDASIESLRFLRTILERRMPQAACKIITFMAVSDGIGKSFISANFAALLAMTGNKVLLLDCDVRRNNLYQYFMHKPGAGLTEILNKQINWQETLIQSQYNTNLSFLSTGKIPAIPTDLLASLPFKELLNKLSLEFNYIIINSSSLEHMHDNAIIGILSDINLLIMGANKHSAYKIAYALKNIFNAGVKIQGAIYNHQTYKKQKKPLFQTQLFTNN